MKFLEKILFYGLILVLFIPLLISDKLVFPFITSKAYAFYAVIDILLLVYLLILSKKPLYPLKSKLFLFFIIITFLGIIFDLFGLSFKTSFWGNYERMMGVYTSLHFLAYLWLLLSIFNTKEKYFKLLKISVVVNFLVIIYSILQKFKVNFWGVLNVGDDRISATFGNPAYLAGWLLLGGFLSVYLFIKTSSKYWRIFYSVVFILNIIVLFWTATRGAIVGLFFGILAMLFYLLFFYKNSKVRLISASFLIVFILAGLSIFIFKDASFIKNNLALSRLSSISLQDTTASSRLSLWKMSISASKERPFLGYGENNIRIPLDKYHDYSLVEDWFDSSHNKFFDELLSHGFVGLFLQISFFSFFFFLIFKKKKTDFNGSMIFFGLLTAYLTQAMFIFDSFIVVLFLLFIFGYLFIDLEEEKSNHIFENVISIYLVIPCILIFSSFFVFLYFHTVVPAKNIVLADRIVESDIGQATKFYGLAEKQLFFNYDILASAIGKQAVTILRNSTQYTDVQLKEYISLMDDVYHKAIKDSNYSNFYINLAKLYQLAPQSANFNYLEQSIELLQQAYKIAPNRIDIYYASAQGYFLQGNITEAEHSLKQALSLGVRQGKTYANLAEVYIRKDNPDLAMEAINKSEEYGRVFSFEELENFAKIFIDRQSWLNANAIFLKIDKIKPNDVGTHINIALSYSKAGNRQEAIIWLNKILIFDPTTKDQVNKFINSL